MHTAAHFGRKASRLLLTAIAAWAPTLFAGEFAIIPLRVTLDRASRSAEVTIRNEDTAPLRMQVEAMSWRQDANGTDQYEPAEGLIYFPRALEIPAGESRIIRVGVRAAPVSQEETYRLFIEQLPPPASDPAPAGATLRVLLRVGVPVFVAPAQIDRRPAITRFDLQAGQVDLAVTNAGNVHFVADRVEVVAVAGDGSRLHAHRFQERYFLAGVSKPLKVKIPREICAKAASLEASVIGENLDLRRKLDVGPGACG